MVKYIMGSNSKLIFLYPILLLLSIHTNAVSNPYGGGKVDILVRNSLPCFYLSNENLQGNYIINFLDFSNSQVSLYSYENTFLKRNITKETCISLEEFNFLRKSTLKLNTIYGVTLRNNRIGYRSEFCLAQKEGETIIEEVKNNQCYEPPKGMWQLIKEALNEYF